MTTKVGIDFRFLVVNLAVLVVIFEATETCRFKFEQFLTRNKIMSHLGFPSEVVTVGSHIAQDEKVRI
jgi:hypothetical protein